MFLFVESVPESIRYYLVPFLQAWIDRDDLPLFAIETIRYGLITFRRDIREADGMPIVSPAGEVDQASLEQLALDQLTGGALGTL